MKKEKPREPGAKEKKAGEPPGPPRRLFRVAKNVGYATIQQRPIVKKMDAILTVGTTRASSLGPILPTPPRGWPRDLAWKPRRYFGPFWHSSRLEEIEVLVQGPSTAIWYHNDFFTNHPDAAPYQPFYPGNVLPSDRTPDRQYMPGYIPPQDGAGVIYFALERVSYSSRYGGTVELFFRSQGNVGLEFRNGQIVWDVTDLLMKIFVTPTKEGQTTPLLAHGKGEVTCEFHPRGVTAYSLTTPSTPFQVLTDNHGSELAGILNVLAARVISDIRDSARRFVAGFLTAQFSELLGPDIVVDSINISDDFIQFFTHKGVPHVWVSFQARNVHSYGADIITEPEFRLTLSSDYVWTSGIIHGPSRTADVENHGATPWVTVGQWTLDEIRHLGSIVLRVSGVEVDWPDSDDVFDTYETAITLDQAELVAAHQHQQYGLVEQRVISTYTDFQGSSWSLFFDLVVDIVLGLR
jgi:hypothetical protein